MSRSPIVDLSEVGALRQTLAAKPPGIVHGVALLLTVTIAAGLAWAYFTRADLVVTGVGRLRPQSSPARSFMSGGGERVVPDYGGRVVAVHVEDGQHVDAGQLLFVVDARRLDNEISQLEHTVATARDELATIDRLRSLYTEQSAAARATLDAEIKYASRQRSRASGARSVAIRDADAELHRTTVERDRLAALHEEGAASASELEAAEHAVETARRAARRAALPADPARSRVIRRERDQLDADLAVRLEDLRTRALAVQSELAAAERTLTNRRLERDAATVRAHAAGVVTFLADVSEGTMLDRGTPAMLITEDEPLRIDAAMSAADVGELAPGMRARIKLASYDYQRYGAVYGTIERVSADSFADQGSAHYYIVSIRLDRQDIGDGADVAPLRPGMTGQVEIIVGSDRLLSLLFKSVRRAVSLG